MGRRQTKQQIEELIIEWATWQCRMLEQSSIGYPKMTPEARMREGVLRINGGSGSRAPNVSMYGLIKTVDRVMRLMPLNVRQAIEERYCGTWDETKKPSGSLQRRLDVGFAWIESALVMSRAS